MINLSNVYKNFEATTDAAVVGICSPHDLGLSDPIGAVLFPDLLKGKREGIALPWMKLFLTYALSRYHADKLLRTKIKLT